WRLMPPMLRVTISVDHRGMFLRNFTTVRLILPILAATVICSTLCLSSAKAQYIDLILFGTPTFYVEPAATTAAYSQTSSGLVFNGAYALGDTIGGTITTADWTPYLAQLPGFIVMSLQGPNPDLPFSVQLYDSGFNIINTYAGTTSGFGPTLAEALTLVVPGTDVWHDVRGAQFTWDGSGTINNLTVRSLSILPETSTYALLLMTGAGALWLARRRR
ncbi:MAG: hypothetical protein ACKO9I_12395, partial [Sphaerospermopsis kisseleviana]